MSFGFSVGDFLAVGKLIADIISSLSDAGGARCDYQDLLRELECLEQALRRLDKLSAAPLSSSQSLDSIKYAALSCRRPLEEFLAKIKGYDNSLGVYSKSGAVVKEKFDRVRWSMGKKEEVARLQNYLSVHVGTVNVLLAEYGLETLGSATGKAEAFQSHVRERLEGVRYILGDIEGNTIAQRQAVEANNSLLTKVYQVVCGEVSVGWKSLVNMVSTVCVTTQQIYGVVLEIRSTLSAPDTRWTFFQDPFLVEDALGRRFPIPSEYDFNLMNAVIQARFEEGPGSEDVQLGNYELVQTRNSKYAISSSTCLRPGTMITMAIVVEKSFWDTRGQVCPIFSCGSNQTISASGGGFICRKCSIWFDFAQKARNRIHGPLRPPSQDPSSAHHMNSSIPSQETQRHMSVQSSTAVVSAEDDAMEFMRFVRVRFPRHYKTLVTVLKRYGGLPYHKDLRRGLIDFTNDLEFTNKGERAEFVEHIKRLFPWWYDMVVQDQGVYKNVRCYDHSQLRPLSLGSALSFLHEIKERYEGNLEIYDDFLCIMQKFGEGLLDTPSVHREISALLKDQPDLVEGFECFMPPTMRKERTDVLNSKGLDETYWNMSVVAVDSLVSEEQGI